MDIQMPEMEGLEATRLIREWEKKNRHGKETKIIAVTANTVNVNAAVCKKVGMDFYLMKPVSLHDLPKAMKEVIQ